MLLNVLFGGGSIETNNDAKEKEITKYFYKCILSCKCPGRCKPCLSGSICDIMLGTQAKMQQVYSSRGFLYTETPQGQWDYQGSTYIGACLCRLLLSNVIF